MRAAAAPDLHDVDLAGSLDVTVLISGGNASMRERLAQRIHTLGRRRGGLFVVWRCSPNYTRFDLALWRQWEAEARSGTIYLDDVADLPRPLQDELFRLLADRCPRARVIAGSGSATVVGDFDETLF